MYTNAQLLTALAAVTVAGVGRVYTTPPGSLDLSAGPVSFPVLPGSDKLDYVTSCIATAKTRRIQYVIIVEAAGQDTIASNYNQLAGLMDALETELDGLEGTVANFVDYTIETTGAFEIGGQDFWAIVAEITIRDA